MYATCLRHEREQVAVAAHVRSAQTSVRHFDAYEDAFELAFGNSLCDRIVIDVQSLKWAIARELNSQRRTAKHRIALHVIHDLDGESPNALRALSEYPVDVRVTFRRYHSFIQDLGAGPDVSATLALLEGVAGRVASQFLDLIVRMVALGERPISKERFALEAGVRFARIDAMIAQLGVGSFSRAVGTVRAGYMAFRRDVLRMDKLRIAELGGWSGAPKSADKFIERVTKHMRARGESASFACIQAELARWGADAPRD